MKLGPILQGAMADTVGWQSFWWLNVAVTGVSLLAIVFAFPETKYVRPHGANGMLGKQAPPHSYSVASEDPAATSRSAALGRGRPSMKQFHILQKSPTPFRSLASAFWQPWKLMCFPIVQFASFIVGFSSTCYLLLTLVQAEAFAAPPYYFSPLEVGFTNFASLVGAFIGLVTAGPLSDKLSQKLTVRNRGVREPEMRLPAMVPYFFVMLLGNFIVAFGLQYGWDWRVGDIS